MKYSSFIKKIGFLVLKDTKTFLILIILKKIISSIYSSFITLFGKKCYKTGVKIVNNF